MPPVEEYAHITEFNFEKLKIRDKASGFQQSFLLPPSSADPRGGPGYCLSLASSDVLTHRRRLLEFTRPHSTAEFFGQIFPYLYSHEQLIAANPNQIEGVMKYVCDHGLTDANHYKSAPTMQGSVNKNIAGCPRLSIDGWKKFSKQWILPEAEKEKELKRWVDEIKDDMRNFGPLVRYFACQRDISSIASEFLYDPSPSTSFMRSGSSRTVSHAIMLVGAGVAYHLPTDKWKEYSIFQNNWGTHGNPIGRIPWEKIADVYTPTFKDQVNLVKYMNDQAAEASWRYELIFDQH